MASRDRAEPDPRAWHAETPDRALEALESRREGLERTEAQQRRRRFGPNELPRRERAGLVRVVARQFKDPLIYILLIAGSVSLGVGSESNAAFIFAVLVVNAGIGAFQEWRAETSAEALQETVRIRVRVRRAGREQELDSRELVPGDVVRLESGSSVPADLRLLSARELRADESLLTGESQPVQKAADEACPEDAPLGDRTTMLHAGTQVLSGRAEGVVCRTGRRTEVGAIARSLAEEDQLPPLVLRLRRFTRTIAVAVLAAILVLSALELWRGRELEQIFFLGVALAVSAIPAGLPVAMTVALSIASTRMARRHVIVRRLAAVEGLGSATLVASDKTGTITANALTARCIRLPDEDTDVQVSGEGHDPHGELTRDGASLDDATRERVTALATAGILANEATPEADAGEDGDPQAGRAKHGDATDAGSDADPGDDDEGRVLRAAGDPTDVAFLVLAAKLGLDRDRLLAEHERVGFLPFESQRRCAASFHREDGEVVAWVKGAPEAVAAMCADADPEALQELEGELADRGLRVLACARGPVSSAGDEPDADDLEGLELLGLVGFLDPVREEVPAAIERCRSAGVDVRMITGDHPSTALQIARSIGLAERPEQVVPGHELLGAEDEDPAALGERLRDVRVFARVEPTRKTDIVKALQADGAFVAVTGDGVNDAPALRTAHVGVAMGRAGTDVARSASDLILTDDDFASIAAGIEEGRIAYDNVRKVIWLLLATGFGEVLLFFLAILSGMPLPLTPIQLLWLNLVTNGIQDVALAFERGEPGVLRRPPRRPDEPIFDRRMLEQVAASGGYIGAVGFAVYWWLLEQQGLSHFQATNLLLLLMVLFENVHVFSCRSETRSAFRMSLRSNPLVIAAVVAAQGIHVASMWMPGLSGVLGVEPVPLSTWATLLAIAASLLVFDELLKWLRRSRTGVCAED